MRRAAPAGAAVLAATALALAPSPPAALPGPLPGPVPPDSQELRERAEERQEAFEERRRSHLETTWGRPVSRCDEVVGRFCLWHADGADWEPPREPEAVRAARRGLVATLDSVARAIPGDPWVAGQRVRYLTEAGRTDRALEAARTCRAADWWCRALAGLVHHRAGRYRDAERSFEEALEVMGRERACRWRDLSDLLEGDLRDRFTDRPCSSWPDLEGAVWWLADPLYLVEGNDRRSEHFARWVLDRTQRDAETPSGADWGEDLQELLVRYGWPVGWERDVSSDDPGASVISHYRDPARRWMPVELGHVRRPGSIAREDWDLEPDRPRSEYGPPYVRGFGRLHSMVSRFRRGDSAVVVAAYRLEPVAWEGEEGDGDSIRVDGWVRSGLFLDRGPDAPAAARTSRTQGRDGVLAVRAPAGPRLLSLEVLAPPDSVAARRRHGIRLRAAPASGVAVSDLMLVEPSEDGSLSGSLDELAARARPTASYRAGDSVGLYWEMYGGAERVERARTSVSLLRRGGGLFQSLGDLLGLGGDDEAVRVEWRDRVRPGRDVHPRTLVFRLPDDLPGDEYELRVESSPAGADSAVARRRIEVRGGG